MAIMTVITKLKVSKQLSPLLMHFFPDLVPILSAFNSYGSFLQQIRVTLFHCNLTSVFRYLSLCFPKKKFFSAIFIREKPEKLH